MHKRKGFTDATVCLFIFDIMYYNGASCLDMTMAERRKLMTEVVKPIQGRVELSVSQRVSDPDTLASLMTHVIDRGTTLFVWLAGLKSEELSGCLVVQAWRAWW